MSGQLELQDYTEIGSDTVQSPEDAVDLGDFGTLVARVSVSRAATTGTLALQHAAVLDEDGFDDLPVDTIDLTSLGTEVRVIRAPLRYLRWRAEVTGTAGFEIDVGGRTPAGGGVEVDAVEDPFALGAGAVKSADETVTSTTTNAATSAAGDTAVSAARWPSVGSRASPKTRTSPPTPWSPTTVS